MADFRDFLRQKPDRDILPYVGGLRVYTRNREYRIREEIQPGWYQFELKGRTALPLEPEVSRFPDKLEKVTGYVTCGRLVGAAAQGKIFLLPSAEELPRFVPVIARRWYDGALLYDSLAFETDTEIAVRRAYEDGGTIEAVKGVTPWLAHAFVLESTARALAQEEQRRRERRARLGSELVELEQRQETLEGRISLALSHAGARLVDWRQSSRDAVTIRYDVAGVRLECIVNSVSLQVIDAGICLDGSDSELNLSSLPAAVREAIEEEVVHVYRRG